MGSNIGSAIKSSSYPFLPRWESIIIKLTNPKNTKRSITSCRCVLVNLLPRAVGPEIRTRYLNHCYKNHFTLATSSSLFLFQTYLTLISTSDLKSWSQTFFCICHRRHLDLKVMAMSVILYLDFDLSLITRRIVSHVHLFHSFCARSQNLFDLSLRKQY